MASWETDLVREREEKDRFFAQHPHSPLPPDQREDFTGLPYYPLDEDLRFELELHVFDEHAAIPIETTQDGKQNYFRWGEFRLEVEDALVTLTAYKARLDEDRLWVPFRDQTSGTETYGAGRYLDLTPEDQTEDGRWVLDFNRAYTPFCAFSDVYECPLVPTENWLDIAVRAGEKSVARAPNQNT